jgi:hypothetical protein
MTDPTPEQQLDAAYRERAHLVAWLAAVYPAVITPAPDVDEPGWQIVYLAADDQQMSWHIAPRDADLFAHVERVEPDDPRAQWDGHTTEQKYDRIRQHVRGLHFGGAAKVIKERTKRLSEEFAAYSDVADEWTAAAGMGPQLVAGPPAASASGRVTFNEPDEDPAEVEAVFEAGEKHVTRPPLVLPRNVVAYVHEHPGRLLDATPETDPDCPHQPPGVTVTDQTACPNCSHPHHLPGTECQTPVHHGPNHWHLCLCLARPGAALSCPPQMACQGGTLGYADVWYLQHGHMLVGEDGLPAEDSEPPAYPWAETVDAAGDTVRIPWLDGDGREVGGITLDRAQAAVLRDMLDGILDDEDVTEAEFDKMLAEGTPVEVAVPGDGHSDACVHPDQHDALRADYEGLAADVREYADDLAVGAPRVDGCGVRERLLAMVMQHADHGSAPDADHAYRDAVNAPLAPETVAAINELLASGNPPVRKVTRRTTAPDAGLREQYATFLWQAAKHHVTAEWICCHPVDPTHELCVQGAAALRMIHSLLIDDPDAASPAPLLDAVLAVRDRRMKQLAAGRETWKAKAEKAEQRLRVAEATASRWSTTIGLSDIPQAHAIACIRAALDGRTVNYPKDA